MFRLWIIQTPSSSHCKFGAWQNLEVACRTGDFANWIKILSFERFCSKPIITLHTTYGQIDLTEQSRIMVNCFLKNVLCCCHSCNLLRKGQRVLRSSWILNECNLSLRLFYKKLRNYKSNRAKNDINSVRVLTYLQYRKWSPKWTANDPAKNWGMEWIIVEY